MSYEQGRQQAIEMLQEAKRKDEDAEYLQSTGNSKYHIIISYISILLYCYYIICKKSFYCCADIYTNFLGFYREINKEIKETML